MKQLSKLCTLLLVLILLLSLSANALAAGAVTYDAGANKFIFAPGTKHSPTSLFENFQNVMPGDTLTEQVLIKNDASNDVKIRVYLRSLGAKENTDNFLSQLKLTVQQREDNILFAAPADQTAQLTDWIYLGTVYSGGEITLDVTLEVPITLDNDYQNEIGFIDWSFKVEELPVDPSDPQPPQTGDSSHVFLYSGLMLFSLFALVILLIGKRKQTANH